ncbi:PRC-barrel domain-containing protein [Alkalinema sp. FACHB-956]|uniref:PRC-barrel domain-containing protein n=1 Tax=Alkalinema sp. FACHB-956 TaxID=2692768 RepID=UPI001681CADF|nr:PRC-barrel domain-containing protein [Alkalinema sp. FACHB-956]MBD2328018.1 PRC-barrel domain-containing protein [Alkalinema sp. FACHB-956]
MRKGSDLIGCPIVAFDTGKKFARVQDLIFDQDRNLLIALLVEEPGFLRDAKVLPIESIQSMGADAVITSSKEDVIPASSHSKISAILDHNNIMKGTQILTVTGQNLGKMVDLYIDENSGVVEGYEVSGGIFADAYSGRSFVPALQTLRIGEDYAFVPEVVAELMEEQVGGLKGAMQTTGEKVQEAAQKAGEQVQEARRQATSQLANTIVPVEAQRSYVLGRITQASVLHPNGTLFLEAGHVVTMTNVNAAEELGILDRLYRATGGDLVEDAKQRAGEVADKLAQKAETVAQDVSRKTSTVTAQYTVNQALGRRAQTIVRTRSGVIVVAPGQIVTQPVVERARHTNTEKELLKSVGLSSTDAAKSSTSDAIATTRGQLSNTAESVGTQVQEGTSQLLRWAKYKTAQLRDQSAQALEEQRIKGALGRPVTRVILDYQDQVILNAGELITHQAIEAARRADVLDVLLASVYTQTPEFSQAQLRAPQPGRAALPAMK